MEFLYLFIFLLTSVVIISAHSKFEIIEDFENAFKETCERTQCVRKCCPEGEFVYVKDYEKYCKKLSKISRRTPDYSNIPLYHKNLTESGKRIKDIYTIVPGILLNEKFNVSSYDYSSTESHHYYLTEDGVLFEEEPNKLRRWHELNSSLFCVDNQWNADHRIHTPSFWTVLSPTGIISYESQNVTLYISGFIISSFFLVLVLVVYALLPDLRSLSGKILMSYVVSMLGMFVLLAVIQLGNYSIEFCLVLAYTAYFFTLAGFCWMTTMSYDFWRLNSSMQGRRAPSRRSTRSKFLIYSAYAWGVPLAMTVFLIIINHIDMRHLPWFVTPSIPSRGCFIGGEEKLLYLYVPMLILIATNWAFFLRTSCHLYYQYKETAMVDKAEGQRQAHRSLVNRFLVYLKLSVIMGISWILEVASSFNADFQLWYITDFYNMLIGFLIFLIFVCNRKVFHKLKKRFTKNECQKSYSIEAVNI